MPFASEPPEFPRDPVTDAVVADAIGAHATESSGHHRPVHTHCENCGTELRGPFCHKCGQHDIDFHRSFGHMFLDALENFFHFDEKMFRNIFSLVFRPGRLTAEFNAGHRAVQMPPLRFYIFVSVLFFFVSFLGSHPANPAGIDLTGSPQQRTAVREALDHALRTVQRETGDPRTKARAERVIQRLKEEVYNPTARPLDPLTIGQTIADEIKKAEAAEKAAPVAPPATPARKILRTDTPRGLNLSVNEKNGTPFERFLTEKGINALEHQEELMAAFIHALPKMLLVCLPFFALFTRVLFRQSRQVYLQHLVLALHFHTFIFLWVLVRNGWGFLAGFAGTGWCDGLHFACNVWLALYPFLMLRRLFANSWTRTVLKTGLLASAYFITLGIVFAGTAIALFLLL